MAKCSICNDTGGEYLDCNAPDCNAAIERMALNDFVRRYKELHRCADPAEVAWAIHQRATAITEKACEERFKAQSLVVSVPVGHAS